MSTLYFKVQSDWEEVQRLRMEIEKLKTSFKGINANIQPNVAKQLSDQLTNLTKRYDELIDKATSAGAKIDQTLKKSQDAATQSTEDLNRGLKALGATLLGGMGLKAFASQIINVRGEFQQMEQSLKTMLGSEEKANELMGKIKEFAKISPLNLKSTVSAAQMMIGFNIEAEKVPRFLSAIGDASQGNAQRLNSLTLAFSQMSAAGKLMGQDLNQMINAGFNPLSEMARTTGKSIAQLKDEMSKGAISAEMVQNAFISATSEGGKFFKMSEEGAKTINGQMSMLQDAMDNAFNEIGKEAEGFMLAGIKGVTALVENYDKIGLALSGLAASYGIIKAAELAQLAIEGSLITTIKAKIAVTKLATVAQAAYNAVCMVNPFVALAAGIVTVGTALYAFIGKTNVAADEQERLNRRTEEQTKLIQDQKTEIDSLINKIEDENTATAQKTEAFETLKRKYPEIFAKYNTEKELLDNLTQARKDENAEIDRRNILLAKGNVEDDRKRKSELQELKSLYRDRERFTNSEKADRYKKLRQKYSPSKRDWLDNEEDYWDKLIAEADNAISQSEKELAKKESENWASTLTGMNKATAEIQKKELENALKVINGTGITSLNVLGESAASDAEEIEKRISLLNSVVINAEYKSAQEYQKAAKDAWEKAQKAVEEVKTGKTKYKSEDEYLAALKKAEEAESIAKANAKKAGVDVSKSSKTDPANAINAQNERIKEIERKQAQDRARRAKDLEWQVEQAKIDAMNDGFEKSEAQRKLNNEKEIEDLKRQKEDFIEAYIQSQKELFDAQEELKSKKDKNYHKKSFDRSSVSVDASAFDNVIASTQKRQIFEPIKEQERAWNEYLQKFGTYQQKRQAIIDSYNERIAASKSAGEQGILEKERDNALDELDLSVQNSANLMAQLFADTSKMSVSEIEKIIEKTELLIQYLNAAKDAEGNAVINGVSYNKESIAKNVGVSTNQIDNMVTDPSRMKDLTDGLENLKSKLGANSPFLLFKKQVNDAVKLIGDKNNKKGLALGIQGIGNAITDFMPAVKEFGNSLGTIFGSSEFGNTIGDIAEGIGGLGQTAAGVGQIMSGDIVGGAMSAVQGISAVVSSFESLFGADYSEYNQMKEEYEGLIDVWDEILDRKKEYISMSWGDEAVKASKEALDVLDKEAKGWKELGVARLNAGASIGSHSIGVRTANNTSAQDWSRIASALGVSTEAAKNMINGQGRMQGLFNLSAEQLQRIQESNVAWWAKLDDDVRDYLNKIIDGAKQVEDINRMTEEQLTQVSFDSMYDGFISKLMDMGIASKDFADDMSQYFMQAMLSERIGNEYQKKLTDWYKRFSNAMKGGLTDAEMSALREEYLGYVNAALEERDNLAKITGYKDTEYSQKASAKAWGSMTQENGEELNGRFTALQVSAENIKNIADEIRTVQVNSFLELQQIRDNTGAIVKPIKDMASDIKDIKKAVE